MGKKQQTDYLEDQKDKLFEAIADLQESLDLDEEDVQKIKDWGATLLIAGASAYLIYRVLKGITGNEKVELAERTVGKKRAKVKKDSSVSRLLKEQIALLLIAALRKRVVRFLHENDIIDEEQLVS